MPLISALAAVAARGYGFLQGRASVFELIETQTVGSGGAASITFSSIPSTYKHLQIRGIGRLSGATVYGTGLTRLNGDTGSNYATHSVYGTGTTTPGSVGYTSQASMFTGRFTAANAASNMFGAAVWDILDYANTSKNKTIRCLTGVDTNGNDQIVELSSGVWLNTSVVTSITFTPNTGNFVQHTSLSLYGIK